MCRKETLAVLFVNLRRCDNKINLDVLHAFKLFVFNCSITHLFFLKSVVCLPSGTQFAMSVTFSGRDLKFNRKNYLSSFNINTIKAIKGMR